MLVPMEMTSEKKLAFECKSCGYQETAGYNELSTEDERTETNRIYKREYKQTGATENTDPDFALDPTMPRDRNVECPKCGYNEAVFFLDKESNEKRLRLRYICARINNGRPDCGWSWAKDDNEIIEEP
eukprot:CAMPEP_0176425416 /NCGR_PEP_ID=MMETSP0127-20121128/11375_1 /TAXON_ID=938130 /ORGANISM="Platyophrya macrostoma, Strain WH" /LENGTH=127 /DNA_ID=CAMNT_0017806571 /DNA_START=90 /DNA_END=473 /DNA_ORIENTATION=+